VELTLFVCRLRVACNEATIYSVYACSLAGTRRRKRETKKERERERGGGRTSSSPRASRASPIQSVEKSIENKERWRHKERERGRERGRVGERERETRRALRGTQTRRRSGKGARTARQESESRLMSRCSIYLLNYICMCMPGNYGGYCARISRAALHSADSPIVIAANDLCQSHVCISLSIYLSLSCRDPISIINN